MPWDSPQGRTIPAPLWPTAPPVVGAPTAPGSSAMAASVTRTTPVAVRRPEQRRRDHGTKRPHLRATRQRHRPLLGLRTALASSVPAPASAQASTPVTVSGLANAVNVSAGNLHTCAVLASGVTGCWGNNGSGQLGDGTAILRSKPVAVTGISTAVAVAAGTDHSCAVVADGSARLLGLEPVRPARQRNDGEWRDHASAPAPWPAAAAASWFAPSRPGSPTIVSSGPVAAVSCWGYNIWGQVGDGGSTSRLTPFTTSVANAVAVAAGDLHSCALTVGSGARCWGINDSGQLGDGTTITRRTPSDGAAGLTNAVAPGRRVETHLRPVGRRQRPLLGQQWRRPAR